MAQPEVKRGPADGNQLPYGAATKLNEGAAVAKDAAQAAAANEQPPAAAPPAPGEGDAGQGQATPTEAPPEPAALPQPGDGYQPPAAHPNPLFGPAQTHLPITHGADGTVGVPGNASELMQAMQQMANSPSAHPAINNLLRLMQYHMAQEK